MTKKTNILEIPIEPIQKNFNYFLNEFHPYYYDMTGNNIPCYKEFMSLIECLKDNKIENKLICKTKYYDLIDCLKKNGLNYKD